MTISRKPRRVPAGGKLPAPINVDAIINRGGTVAVVTPEPTPGPISKPARKSVLLNLYPETIERINQAVNVRSVRITRQTWIEEAIQEKLSRLNS